MEKKISLLVMIICCMIMRPVFAQQATCHIENGACQGSCGTWYWGTDQPNQQPKVAGNPTCSKISVGQQNGHAIIECHCFLTVTTTGCREDLCNVDGCPSVYASIPEAQLGINPIKGVCIKQRTGAANNCACQYEYPKAHQ